mmetsp:Transcript_108483/g.346204  ORF Transcript_108483/g.346204 Transcript_108483/m.346204 type:complete len:216 (-) Transcript_108483:1531-2178(-)
MDAMPSSMQTKSSCTLTCRGGGSRSAPLRSRPVLLLRGSLLRRRRPPCLGATAGAATGCHRHEEIPAKRSQVGAAAVVLNKQLGDPSTTDDVGIWPTGAEDWFPTCSGDGAGNICAGCARACPVLGRAACALRGKYPIEGDLQRFVQHFRNEVRQIGVAEFQARVRVDLDQPYAEGCVDHEVETEHLEAIVDFLGVQLRSCCSDSVRHQALHLWN